MYFKDYFNKIQLSLNSVEDDNLKSVSRLISDIGNNKIITVGNGGSASIANHATIDLVNAAKIKAISFTDPGLITCFANDYGYENWVSKALNAYADPDDLLILISSSGQSKNMIEAAKTAKEMNLKVITFTGFSSGNPLRGMGCLNFWVDSKEYNNIEMTHHIWLLAIIDHLIENRK
jgi:D-sedoheptulose 7-phosphate isomerase